MNASEAFLFSRRLFLALQFILVSEQHEITCFQETSLLEQKQHGLWGGKPPTATIELSCGKKNPSPRVLLENLSRLHALSSHASDTRHTQITSLVCWAGIAESRGAAQSNAEQRHTATPANGEA